MSTAPAYLAANAQALENFRALLSRLSEADLLHAFYDLRVVALVERWRRKGAVSPSPLDFDMLNQALLPIWLTIPPRRAATLALETAEAADACVASLEPTLLAGLAGAGTPVKLNRAEHRQEHIVQIEQALAG